MAKTGRKRGKKVGRKALPPVIFGNRMQKHLARKLHVEWRAKILESSQVADPVTRELLADELANQVVTSRLLREGHAAGKLTGDEVRRIPGVAGRIMQLLRELKMSTEVEDDDGGNL